MIIILQLLYDFIKHWLIDNKLWLIIDFNKIIKYKIFKKNTLLLRSRAKRNLVKIQGQFSKWKIRTRKVQKGAIRFEWQLWTDQWQPDSPPLWISIYILPPSPSIVYIGGGHGNQDNVWKMSKVRWKVGKVVGSTNI